MSTSSSTVCSLCSVNYPACACVKCADRLCCRCIVLYHDINLYCHLCCAKEIDADVIALPKKVDEVLSGALEMKLLLKQLKKGENVSPDERKAAYRKRIPEFHEKTQLLNEAISHLEYAKQLLREAKELDSKT